MIITLNDQSRRMAAHDGVYSRNPFTVFLPGNGLHLCHLLLVGKKFDWVLIIGKQLYQITLAIGHPPRTVGKFLFSYRLATSLHFKMSIKF